MIKNYLPSVGYTVVQPSNFYFKYFLEAYPVHSSNKRQAPKDYLQTIGRAPQQKSYSKPAIHERASNYAQPE